MLVRFNAKQAREFAEAIVAGKPVKSAGPGGTIWTSDKLLILCGVLRHMALPDQERRAGQEDPADLVGGINTYALTVKELDAALLWLTRMARKAILDHEKYAAHFENECTAQIEVSSEWLGRAVDVVAVDVLTGRKQKPSDTASAVASDDMEG